ncbi:DUF4126 domain-containing protein [Candidatus Sumerlaeota bacterium]|nr:DUF4126 domain-containing protein [Candidatus Sumerlaeota bacterium]
MDATEILTKLALTLGASWCAGINLYATIAVLGLMHRYIAGFALPGDMAVLANDWVLWPALALYVIEFVADKVPAVDSVWDTIHTFIRVPAGAVLAAMALGQVPLEFQICAALLGGPLAFGSHATKSTLRVAAHSTGTSPVLSPVLSVAEDVAVVGTVALIAAHPVISLALVCVMLVASYFIIRAFWRLAKKAVRAMTRLFKKPIEEDPAMATVN